MFILAQIMYRLFSGHLTKWPLPQASNNVTAVNSTSIVQV